MRRKIPSLNAIRAFEAVARYEHLGQAAEELCVSQSALSQQVKHLEAWLDAELFVRARGRLFLKPEGQELLAGYTEALDILQATSLRLTERKAVKPLVILCDPAFLSKCLIGKVQSLREAIAPADIEIITSNQLPESFPEHVDIIIHYQSQPGWPDIHVTHMLDIYGFPACSPALLRSMPTPKRPNDLQHFHLLHGDDRQTWNAWLRKYNARAVNGYKGTFYDDFSLTVQAAVNGEGAVIADPVMCKEELKSGKLVPVFEDTIFCASYHMYCHQKNYQNAAVKAVHSKLIEK